MVSTAETRSAAGRDIQYAASATGAASGVVQRNTRRTTYRKRKTARKHEGRHLPVTPSLPSPDHP